MYSTQMRWQKIIRVLLIIFIVNQLVNFAFGAPMAVREKLEKCIDADRTEDGTAALQERVNIEEGLTNLAGQTPKSSDRTETDRFWQLLRPRRIPAATFPNSDPTSLTPRLFPMPPPGDPPKHPIPPVFRPPLLPNHYRPYHPNRPNRPKPPYGIVLANNPRKPLHPFYRLISFALPYLPPSWLHTTSPPSIPEERLQAGLSLAIGNSLTTGHQLSPQQSAGPDLDVPPPSLEPQPLPNPEQPLLNQEKPPPSQGPHPSTSGETAIDEVLDTLKNTKIKRTFPAPVQ